MATKYILVIERPGGIKGDLAGVFFDTREQAKIWAKRFIGKEGYKSTIREERDTVEGSGING